MLLLWTLVVCGDCRSTAHSNSFKHTRVQCNSCGEIKCAVCSFLGEIQESFLLLAFHRPLAQEDLLTLANSCSISTDMVSNILSWVELFSSGVVSDLEEEKQMMESNDTTYFYICCKSKNFKVFLCLNIAKGTDLNCKYYKMMWNYNTVDFS